MGEPERSHSRAEPQCLKTSTNPISSVPNWAPPSGVSSVATWHRPLGSPVVRLATRPSSFGHPIPYNPTACSVFFVPLPAFPLLLSLPFVFPIPAMPHPVTQAELEVLTLLTQDSDSRRYNNRQRRSGGGTRTRPSYPRCCFRFWTSCHKTQLLARILPRQR